MYVYLKFGSCVASGMMVRLTELYMYYTCMVSRKARLLHERESKILTCNPVAQDPHARWLPSSELTEGHNLTYWPCGGISWRADIHWWPPCEPLLGGCDKSLVSRTARSCYRSSNRRCVLRQPMGKDAIHSNGPRTPTPLRYMYMYITTHTYTYIHTYIHTYIKKQINKNTNVTDQ